MFDDCRARGRALDGIMDLDLLTDQDHDPDGTSYSNHPSASLVPPAMAASTGSNRLLIY